LSSRKLIQIDSHIPCLVYTCHYSGKLHAYTCPLLSPANRASLQYLQRKPTRHRGLRKFTHPTNFRAVTGSAPSFPALGFSVLRVTNFHCAFSPSGVSSAFHVRRTMFPLDVPVARTPSGEYSRSWNARDVICSWPRERVTISRAFTVYSRSSSREQVAMKPCFAPGYGLTFACNDTDESNTYG
jgi:hypothetical protein